MRSSTLSNSAMYNYKRTFNLNIYQIYWLYFVMTSKYPSEKMFGKNLHLSKPRNYNPTGLNLVKLFHHQEKWSIDYTEYQRYLVKYLLGFNRSKLSTIQITLLLSMPTFKQPSSGGVLPKCVLKTFEKK